MTARAPRTRAVRLREELHARRRRPGPSSDATAAETAHLAVLQAVDHLLALALLELFVTPPSSDQPASRQPARQLVAIARHLQEALAQDMTGTTTALDALFDALNREEQPA